MVKHNITISSEVRGAATAAERAFIKRCVKAALEAEGITEPCEINILLTDNEGIREINLDMRGIDSPTDVLSFPMFELKTGEKPDESFKDPETGLVPLGDMALSVERARAQAAEYDHSESREIGYLTVHSVLHLLGYDHIDEEVDKPLMRSREEAIMSIFQ